METKKNPKVDLERYRGLFFATALVMVLTVALSVLNYRTQNTTDHKIYSIGYSEALPELHQEISIGKVRPQKQNPTKVVPTEDETELSDTIKTEPENAGLQENESGKSSEYSPLRTAEIMPEYPGGMAALRRDLAKAIKLPPEISSGKLSGTVYVQFVVTKTGNVDKLEILQPLHKDLDHEVIKALKSIKKFKPASQNGQAVAVYFILPLSFNI